MLLTIEDHYDTLFELLEKKPTKVFISSFGLYAGITADGKDWHQRGGKYTSRTHEFLDKLSTVEDVRVLIGAAEYISCKVEQEQYRKVQLFCEDCFNKYGETFKRLLKHTEAFPYIHWRIRINTHLKMTMFQYADNSIVTVLGGRNLTDSDWPDVTFRIDSENENKRLHQSFMEWWDDGLNVCEDSISELLELLLKTWSQKNT